MKEFNSFVIIFDILRFEVLIEITKVGFMKYTKKIRVKSYFFVEQFCLFIIGIANISFKVFT